MAARKFADYYGEHMTYAAYRELAHETLVWLENIEAGLEGEQTVTTEQSDAWGKAQIMANRVLRECDSTLPDRVNLAYWTQLALSYCDHFQALVVGHRDACRAMRERAEPKPIA